MIDITELPVEIAEYIVRLRKEAARYRTQRNGARREADRLKALNAELRAELAAAQDTGEAGGR